MRNTLQEQYNLIKEGKGNKQQFFKSARQLFPDLITPINTYDDTVRILKNRSIIAEGIGGVVTKGKTPDWHAIFKENITEAAKEAKAEEKETTKEVTDMATRGYDYKDYKNIDNIYGEAFLKGFYTEMGDPKNEGKTVEELRQIVAKNMAKDCLHYTKEGQFGLKGVGYTTEAPGLGTPKEPKGKHKSSGYGDLKESVLRSQIYLLVKEVLSEAKAKFNVGDIVTYKGEEYKITRFIDDRIYIKSIIHGGRGESWVTASDLQKAALTEEKSKSDLKVILNNLKKALAIAEKEIKIVDKNGKAFKEFEKTIAGKKREIEAVEREIKALEKKSLTEDNGYEMGEGDIVKYKKEYAKSDTHFMITKDLGDTVVMRKVDAQGEPVGPFIPQVGKVQLEPVDIEFKQGLETGDLDS
jgi:hypothetical protein